MEANLSGIVKLYWNNLYNKYKKLFPKFQIFYSIFSIFF